MQKKFLLPVFALIMGICGAGIRAVELSRAFEPESGLQVPGEPSSILMRYFTIAVILLYAVFSFVLRSSADQDRRILVGDTGTFVKISVVSAAFLLIAAPITEFMLNRDGVPLSRIIQILLALFAGASILIRAMKTEKDYAFFSLVPIFWCCFWLILIYRDRSIDPVVPDYIYELFAVVASALFFYGIAGFDFGSRNVRMNVFFGTTAIYLSVVTALGPVLAKLLYETDIVNADTLLYFAACAVYALGGVVWLLSSPGQAPAPQSEQSAV